MLEVSELLYDPDLSQDFVVHRKSGLWVNGRFEETDSTLTFTGIIIPANAKEIVQFPEADRITGVMKFYSEQEIHTTHAEGEGGPGTSDQIEWRGKRYRIINSMPYIDYGYYVAYGVYMESD